MVTIDEIPDRDEQKLNFGQSASARKRRLPKSSEAQSAFADKVFGGKRAPTSKKKADTKVEGSVPTGKETNTDAVLGTLKAFDISISRLIAFCASTESPYRLLCIILEWTGHGVPWFAIIIYFILGLKSGNTSGMYLLFNILFGLLLDVACVGTIKTIVKRPRPKYNQSHDMHGCVSADKYSFPSGHACRVVLMALLLLELLPGLTAPTIFL